MSDERKVTPEELAEAAKRVQAAEADVVRASEALVRAKSEENRASCELSNAREAFAKLSMRFLPTEKNR